MSQHATNHFGLQELSTAMRIIFGLRKCYEVSWRRSEEIQSWTDASAMFKIAEGLYEIDHSTKGRA